jgi:hypothetical protein
MRYDMRMFNFLRFPRRERPATARQVSWVEIEKQYQERLAYAEKMLADDPTELKAGIAEVKAWRRQQVKKRIKEPL